jgi:2,3-bisphosphoglycerate-independent phosphoglycerate mutase
MKCVVVLACGLAEDPRESLGGKTPLEAARTPVLDQMASRGILGLTRTIPHGARLACETGGASLLGYDPAQHPVRAAGLEALGVGVELGPRDVAFRATLVTLDANEDGTEILGDALGGRLPPSEAAELIEDLARAIGDDEIPLHAGLGHRHLLVWRGGDADVRTTSPYELVDKPIAGREPSGGRSDVLRRAMDRAREVLSSHPVCMARRSRAERVPTAFWPWDPSGAVSLPSVRDCFGLAGVVLAATPLGRGLGLAAGLTPLSVSGATADVDTNVAAEVETVLASLATHDLAVLHLAAADLAAHAGDAQRKVTVIERLDELCLGPLLEGLRKIGGDWRVLVAADHGTSCETRLHSAEPVPFCVCTERDESKPRGQKRGFSERDAREQGVFIPEAYTLLERLARH